MRFAVLFVLIASPFLVCSYVYKSDAEVISGCFTALESHLCQGEKWGLPFHFYRPSLEKYSPDQWLWDSGAHMITWSSKNVSNSYLDMKTMLQMQRGDGFIPEEIFWGPRDKKQNAEILLQYSSDKFTDTTQMPVLPYSLRAIYQNQPSKEEARMVLKEFLYPLVKYMEWWRNTRDDGDGLITIIHNWESGLDASPAYDPAFGVYLTDVNKKSYLSLYPKFLELVESYKFLYHWNVSKILGRSTAPKHAGFSWFKVKDAAVNSVYAGGWEVLAELANELGDSMTAKKCSEQGSTTSNAIMQKMWNAENKQFHSLWIDQNGKEQSSQSNTVQNLFPLLIKGLASDQVESIVAQIADPAKFMATYSIPTVSQDDPQFSATFDADLMWRGPVWGFTNWFVLEGLGLYKQDELQKKVLDRWIQLVKLSGISEHYNPLTGAPYGAENLGMSTLVCDWMQKLGRGAK